MASFVEQIMMQAQGASAQGEGFGQYALEGMKLGQNRRALDLEERRTKLAEQQQSMLLPYQQQALQTESLSNISKLMLEQQGRQSIAEFGGLIADISSSQAWDKPETERKIWEFIKRYPESAKSPLIQDVFSRMDTARKAAAQLAEPLTPTADMKNAAELDRLTQAIAAETDPAKKARLQSQLTSFQSLIARPNTTVFDPATGKPIVQIGGSGNNGTKEVTTATQTRFEQAEATALQTAFRARRLLPLLSAENVGPRGMLTRTAEAVAGTIIPDYKVGTSIEAVTVARQFKSGLIDMLKSDSNVTQREIDSIDAALPQPEKFFTASNQEKVKLAATLEDVGQISRNNAKTRGKAITPIWLLPSEIDAQFKAGTISEAEAKQLLDGNMWIFIALTRQGAQSK